MWEAPAELTAAIDSSQISLGEWLETGEAQRDSLDRMVISWKVEREECEQIGMILLHLKWLLRTRHQRI